ncbi:MAG: MFS transporter [Pseudolysinimonas sp.]|uniref:MFS transporter n=1 Tax=Pseudolysinimonas sp. TaxID=2680009 RepID=UPI00326693BD
MTDPSPEPIPGDDPSLLVAAPSTRTSLWRHGGFLRLWAGQTASQFGAQLGGLAIPVLAVQVLAATEFQIGLLNALQTAAFLVIGLPAGAWIDRWIKRRVMILADLVRALSLALIPVLWFAGILEFWHILVIATVIGVATVFFDVSYQSFLPVLVPRDDIAEANSKLEGTSQIARVGGPALAGGLLAIVQAPVLLAGTAFTYLLSMTALLSIRDRETPKPRSERRPLVVEIREGVAFVVRQPLLRRIVLCTGVGNFFNTIALTMLPILVLRHLGLGAPLFGLIGSIGAIGGILGALFAARLGKILGEGTVIPLSATLLGFALLLTPLAGMFPTAAIPLLIAMEFVLSVTVLVYNVTQVSFRQRICPPALLGRMNASIRFFVWGVMPIGALLSGVLAATIGVVPTMWIGAVGTLLSAAFVVFSPLLGMRALPDTMVPAATAESGIS